MKTIKYIRGDVTEPVPLLQGDKCRIIIPHCCNDIGAMGAGVALSIKNKWPEVYEKYKTVLELGRTSFKKVGQNICVANMVAQTGVRGHRPLKYASLIACMNTVAMMTRTLRREGFYPEIHAPKFGSALAGGNWDFIEELIEELWLPEYIDVVIYEF